MTSPRLLLAVILVAAAISPAFADDVNHFRGFPPPPDEARILALTGVREHCCHYEIAPNSVRFLRSLTGNGNYQADFNLIAEEYSGTTCIKRYLLSGAVDSFTDVTKPETGIVSIGWNEEQHTLTSVIENGQFYSPWTAHVHIPDFDPVDAQFFENSAPEIRHSKDGGDYALYPVLGICGSRTYKIPGQPGEHLDVKSLLGTYQFVKAKNAVIIYLYATSLGDVPPLKFDNLSHSK
jgi:hypothetical protein